MRVNSLFKNLKDYAKSFKSIYEEHKYSKAKALVARVDKARAKSAKVAKKSNKKGAQAPFFIILFYRNPPGLATRPLAALASLVPLGTG